MASVCADTNDDVESCSDSNLETDDKSEASSAAEPHNPWTSSSMQVATTCVVMYICSLAYTIVTGNAEWIGTPYGIAMFFIVDIAVLSALAFMMYYVYRLLGFSPEDIKVMTGPRSEWSEKTADVLMSTYGERLVKITDAVNRRMGHVVGGLVKWSTLVPFWIPTKSMRIAAMFSYTFCKVFGRLFVMSGQGCIVEALFRATRIRDGRLGRLNVMLVHFVGMGFYPLVSIIIAVSHIAPEHQPYILGYCWQPLIWGDTAAEIIGSFFGRIQFEVYGFGDINKKTVEGVLACLAASFLSCAGYASLHQGFPSDNFGLPNIMILHLIAATVSTVAETAAPRGTDNGFMVLSVAATCILAYNPAHIDGETALLAANGTAVLT